jgi:hypothetical protein
MERGRESPEPKASASGVLDEEPGWRRAPQESRLKSLFSFYAGIIAAAVLLGLIGSAAAIYYAGTQQIVVKVAPGTAPFAVASTTKVANLNAERLDNLTSGNYTQDTPKNWSCRTVTNSTSCDTNLCSAAVNVSCNATEVIIQWACQVSRADYIYDSYPSSANNLFCYGYDKSNNAIFSLTGYVRCCQ